MTVVEDPPVAVNGRTTPAPSTELVRRTSDVPNALAEKQQLAEVLAKSELLPRGLQGRPQNVLVIMFAAQSLAMDLFPAFQELYIVHGNVGMSALMMRNRVLELGHYIEPLDEESDTQKATVLIQRRGRKEHRVTFTIAEAIQAGLCTVKQGHGIWARGKSGEKTPWETATADMLVARATARAVRRHVPEAILGAAYTPEELESGVYDDEPTTTVEQVQPDQPKPTQQPAAEDVVDADVVEDPPLSIPELFAAVDKAVAGGDRKGWQAEWTRARDADLFDANVGDKPVKVWLTEAAKAIANDAFQWTNPLAETTDTDAATDEPDHDPTAHADGDADGDADGNAAEPATEPEGEESTPPPADAPQEPAAAADEVEPALWPEAVKPGTGTPRSKGRRGGDPS